MDYKYSKCYYAAIMKDDDGVFIKYVNGVCPRESDTEFSRERFPELASKITPEQREKMLLFCCQRRDYPLIKYLLDNGTPPNITAVMIAVSEADLITLKILFKYIYTLELLGEQYHNVLQRANELANKGPLNMEIYDCVRAKFTEDLRKYSQPCKA